ncbi:flagellar motor protein MotB [Thioclava sp. SK-1]|uniref:peptidoglycan -binding protein n=1 Tax=Thioclava sp. SK-1 TaxID=1889770 RepID=UPI0008242BE9|nr:peptidoglycan -binding protein [Thioclava sp. SK-1]OCX66121.1 flagellar motor protein MotB [Thioclava sp. SK-1]
MGLQRRGANRFSANIWPGFVDAMTALLLVLMFVLTIFMVVQSVLRETITTKETELSVLAQQVAGLADALSLSEIQVSDLQGALDVAQGQVSEQNAMISALNAQLDANTSQLMQAEQQITAFESQVAALLAASSRDQSRIASLEASRDAARADADSRAEQLRLDRATMEALREKLQASGDELAAMTLALEQARADAEDTLTLLAAAEAARDRLQGELTRSVTEAERKEVLAQLAQKTLAQQEATGADAARKLALLNQQIASLRGQLGQLQGLLDDSAQRDTDSKVQVEALGSQLNQALAQLAAEQKRRAALEEQARLAAEAEARDLTRYRSEFFGRLSQILEGREGVKVVGDRFVFSSEVLFAPGSATLSAAGQAQIAQVTQLLEELAAQIPPELDWIIRVDGHTDNVPLSGQGQFRDNWELSQARALSVVRYMTDALGFAPERLAATGFAEFRPVAEGNSEAARAQNRRIELKLTER